LPLCEESKECKEADRQIPERVVTWWMAEFLVTLPAKQVAWVQSPVPARPTFSVEKWLFSVTLRRGHVLDYKMG
jgi:hypothetical protein